MKYFYSFEIRRPGHSYCYAGGHGLMNLEGGVIDDERMAIIHDGILEQARNSGGDLPSDAVVHLLSFNSISNP